VKLNSVITILGVILIFCGVVLFYSLQNIPDLDPELKALKHLGTFAGLSGIGVVIAGILLTLTSRQQTSVEENFEGLE